MPPSSHPRPATSDAFLFRGLAYEVFKIAAILAAFSVISITALQTTRLTPASPVPLWLQNIYYAANIAVALAAIVALFYAKNQADAALRQAEISANASKAEVYQALFQDFISPIFQHGAEEVRALYLLHAASQSDTPPALTLDKFCTQQITAMETADPQRFRKLANLFTFLESVGLQARRGYLSRDDIFHMLKGPLTDLRSIVLDYLETKARARDGAWAQAIWLLNTIPNHQPENRLPD